MLTHDYLNPDPWVRLIGESNETQVKLEGQTFEALIDSGAVVSQITQALATSLGLKIRKLKKIIPMEGAGGVDVPYMGYVEASLQIPEVKSFNEDCLFLVVSDHRYGNRVPLTIGTLHIDMIIEKATKDELEEISIAWGRGQLFRKIQARQTQLNSQPELDKIHGHVKLTKDIKILSGQTLKVVGRSDHPLNSKRVNVILEPTESEYGQYTVPSYSFLKSNSRRVNIGLRNMSCKAVTIKKGTAVAQLSPANVIPKMLAPKLAKCQLESADGEAPENSKLELPKVTDSDRIEKLFSKLDLSGSDSWSEEEKNSVRNLIEKFHHIFAVEDLELGKTNIVKHEIHLDNYVPFKERYRRIPPHQYEEVKKHLNEMLEIGAIRRSSSPWASAVVLVRKKDGTLRFCIDLRKLNARTIKDAYSLPRIEDSLDTLNGSCIFTSIDLKAGYWQVELDEKSIPLTAFTVGPLGFFECSRMPFGLTNAPATFQRLMETCLGDLHLNWCIIYLDDVIVFSKTPKEHIERLEAVFRKISEAGLKLKPSKCEFFKSRIHYLGHIVSKNGIETDPKKIEAIKNWPVPRTVHDVRSFLGFTNYYRKFVYKYAHKARPLNKLISGENAKKKNRKVEWTPEHEATFQELKTACSETPVLAYANYKKSFRLNTDASKIGLGAVLYQQQDDNSYRVIAYASRSLSKTEQNYDAHKLEFLALKWSVTERFHEYLYGGDFDVYTDNNPLTYVLTSAKLDATGQRWIACLANYNFQLFYKAGKLHVDADTLSRIPWEINKVEHTPLDTLFAKSVLVSPMLTQKVPHLPNAVIPLKELVVRDELVLTKDQWKREQNFDYSIRVLINLLHGNKLASYSCKKEDPEDLKCMIRMRKEFFLEGPLLYRKAYFKNTNKTVRQFVLPHQFRKKTVTVCHDDYGHMGMDRVLILLQERYYWPKMSEDVRKHIRCCDRCTRFKQLPEKEQLFPITATYPLELIHIDFLTIGGKKDKFKNILVVTDHFTRYAQCFVTNQQTAKVVADTMVNQYFTHYGWPDKILTDRGSSFENALFKEICAMARVKKLRTTSYHPQTNGQCERFNKTLIRMIGTLPANAKSDWRDWIPTLVHTYNCSTSSTTGFSPYFLIYGREPKLPIDIEYGVSLTDSYSDCKSYADKLQHRLKWAYEAAQKCMNKESLRHKKYYDRTYKCATLEKDDIVLVRVVKPGTDYKIADKWEQDPWIIIRKREGTPVFDLRNTRTGEVKELHRNLLYPLRLVNNTDTEETTQRPQAKQCTLDLVEMYTTDYFACDCRHCMEAV